MSKGEQTRQRIVAEAAAIFNQRGYAGCSMQDILDATGLEKGGLYRHFESKEELAAEAFRYALARAVKLRTESLEQMEGALEKLLYVVRRFAQGGSGLPGGCPLMNTAIDADDGNPVLRQLVQEGIQDWKARICAMIEEGVRRGELDRKVEPRRVANTMIGLLEGALMISRLEGDASALQDAQATLETMLRGLAVAG